MSSLDDMTKSINDNLQSFENWYKSQPQDEQISWIVLAVGAIIMLIGLVMLIV